MHRNRLQVGLHSPLSRVLSASTCATQVSNSLDEGRRGFLRTRATNACTMPCPRRWTQQVQVLKALRGLDLAQISQYHRDSGALWAAESMNKNSMWVWRETQHCIKTPTPGTASPWLPQATRATVISSHLLGFQIFKWDFLKKYSCRFANFLCLSLNPGPHIC